MWVTETEIALIAEFLGLPAAEVVHTYVRPVGPRRSLKELPGGDCVFWGGDQNGCLVYPARPRQCRAFPFWPEHLASAETWEKLGRRCPGLNSGPLRSRRAIEARMRA